MKEKAKVIIIIDGTKNIDNLEKLLNNINELFENKDIILCTKLKSNEDISDDVEIRTPEFLSHIKHIRT